MISPITASKVFSTLGNNNSLTLMALKDISNSLGLTAGSYITGNKVEGEDKFIDEFGTQAIWLFGIPGYKWIIDNIMFKPFGFDAGVDVRVLKDKEVYEKAKKFAKLHDKKYKNNPKVQKIAKSLEDITTKQKVFKGLTFGKFVASTLLTILSYNALTNFRQKYREDKITKEFYEKQTTVNKDTFLSSNNKNTGKAPSFTGRFNLQDFMFSPVKNLMIVDGAITTQRLAKSQNKQELLSFGIKEGSFWLFMYFAGPKIKTWLEKKALKKHNLPISLDARVIECEELKNALLNKQIMHNINQFPFGNPSAAEIYEFVNTNPDNLIVKMAKKSDIIKTVKGTDSIDNRKFIDPEEIKELRDNLKTLWEKSFESGDPESFLKKVKSAKRVAVLKNIGACIGALGILMPAVIVAWRHFDKDNQEFQVKKDIEKKLMAEMKQNL